jgi:hypothetical protein
VPELDGGPMGASNGAGVRLCRSMRFLERWPAAVLSSCLSVRRWQVSRLVQKKCMGGAARPDRAREASDRGILGAGAYWGGHSGQDFGEGNRRRLRGNVRWRFFAWDLSRRRALWHVGRRGPAPSRVLRTPGLRLLPPTPRSPAAQRADRRSSFLRHQRRFRSCRDESLSPLVRSGLLPQGRDSGRLVHSFSTGSALKSGVNRHDRECGILPHASLAIDHRRSNRRTARGHFGRHRQ